MSRHWAHTQFTQITWMVVLACTSGWFPAKVCCGELPGAASAAAPLDLGLGNEQPFRPISLTDPLVAEQATRHSDDQPSDISDLLQQVDALSNRLYLLESGAVALPHAACCSTGHGHPGACSCSNAGEGSDVVFTRETTGRLHLDYWGFPYTSAGVNRIETGSPDTRVRDRFELRRIRLGVRGEHVASSTTYQLDLEFAGVDRIGIRDAWIGRDNLRFFQHIRVGNQKRPYSLAHLNSSNFTIFIERPTIADAVNETNRRFGVQCYGNSDDLLLNWRYGVFNLVEIDQTGFVSANSYQTELAGRLAATPRFDSRRNSYIHTGVSTSFAFPDDNSGNSEARFRSRPEARTVARWVDTGVMDDVYAYQILGAETVMNWNALQFGAEYMNIWLQRSSGLADLHMHGGYVYASYFLTGEHIPWDRHWGTLGRVTPHTDYVQHRNHGRRKGCGAWQIATRLSTADLSDEDIFGGRSNSITVALNWYWNSHTRVQLNYLIGEIQGRAVSMPGPPSIESGSFQVAGLRLGADF